MCETCGDIDKNIERYVAIRQAIDDQTTLQRVKRLIAELQDTKAALHPDQARRTTE